MKNVMMGLCAWWLVIFNGSSGVQLGGQGFEPYQSLEHCQRAAQMAQDNSTRKGLQYACVPDEMEVGE